jgi:hypothetical protein
MTAIETVYIAYKLKVSAPLVESKQIEVGGADEKDRSLVSMEIPTDIRDTAQVFPLGTGAPRKF